MIQKKICLLGSNAVGKTSLVARFVHSIYSEVYFATIGVKVDKKVVSVNTSNYAGKKKRERRADFGRKPHWKKAIVTLKEGEKIDLV